MHQDKFGKLTVDETDQCKTCAIWYDCPLVEALVRGMAVLTAIDVFVDNCSSYKPEERHLKVVK